MEVEARLVQLLSEICGAPPRSDVAVYNASVESPLYEAIGAGNVVNSSLAGECAYDEERLPFEENSISGAVSVLSMHAVNDLPGSLVQYRRAIRDGGFFIAALFGGDSFRELKHATIKAQQSRLHIYPYVPPLIDVRDGGALLQRAGFKTCVSDSDVLTLSYDEPLDLMRDLRNIGESNCLHERRRGLMHGDLLRDICSKYERNEGGGVSATIEVITLVGVS